MQFAQNFLLVFSALFLGVISVYHKNVDTSRLIKEGCQAGYTVSIGIADDEISDSYLSDVLAQADSALYQAKHQDRNRTVMYR